MTKAGHQRISVGVALATAAVVLSTTSSWAWATLAAFMVIPGGTAPDWMEIAKWEKKPRRTSFMEILSGHGFVKYEGERQSWIPHRTITHYMSLWIGAIGWCGYQLYLGQGTGAELVLYVLGIGFAAGGLSHVLCDLLTPMGVPVLDPTCRKSLHLVHSVTAETPIALLSFISGGALLCATIYLGPLQLYFSL